MSKPVRIREIAAKAKCTSATVSLALNNSERLPERTRTRIQKIAQEMGYIPNRQAKSLSLGRTGVMGVIMPMASDPYYAAMLDALVQAASERDFQLQVQFHRWALAEEFRAIRQMAEARADGIFHYPARRRYDGEIADYLQTMRTPLCMLSNLGGGLTIPPSASALLKDYASEAKLIAQELEAAGYTSVDILHPTFPFNGARKERYQALLDHPRLKARIYAPELHDAESFSGESGFSLVQDDALMALFIDSYVNSCDRAPVVVASNFRIAWRLLAAMARKGLRCPEDLAIISIGHQNGGNEGPLPLTTLEYDTRVLADYAFDLLLSSAPEKSPEIRMLAPRIVYRESCPAATHSSLQIV